MKFFWSKFRNDYRFLPQYILIHLGVLLIAIFLMGKIHSTDYHSFKLTHLFVIPLAILLGMQVPTLMHNCLHGNLKNKYLNYIVGELSCFFILMGMGLVSINHTLHHAYADSDQDPHNPADSTYLQFLFTFLISGTEIIKNQYYKFHGKNKRTIALFYSSVVIHYFTVGLRLVAWFLILGPIFFAVLFLPAFLAYFFVFTHVNYITHGTDENGKSKILNLDSNIYYRFMNFTSHGIYYHKNHHINPRLYNPELLLSQVNVTQVRHKSIHKIPV